MYIERNVHDLSKQQILDKACLNSANDIVCFAGSRAAGLQHGHSDYDAIVITSGPIPDSRASGTKFYYGAEPNILSLDIMYLSLDVVTKLLSLLELANRKHMLRVSRNELMHIWRIAKAEPIHNQKALEDLQEKFGPRRVDEMVAAWNRVRGLASLLEGFDALNRKLANAAIACTQLALTFAAEAACASAGDSYPNDKFVHEKCARMSRFMPDILSQLWDLESRDLSTIELPGYLEECRVFCETYLAASVPKYSPDMLREVPLKVEATLVSKGSIHYIVWNKSDVFQVSDFVAAVWRNLEKGEQTISKLDAAMFPEVSVTNNETIGPCRIVVESLEEAGLVRFDWLAAAEQHIYGSNPLG